jgi:hypothetical protein
MNHSAHCRRTFSPSLRFTSSFVMVVVIASCRPSIAPAPTRGARRSGEVRQTTARDSNRPRHEFGTNYVELGTKPTEPKCRILARSGALKRQPTPRCQCRRDRPGTSAWSNNGTPQHSHEQEADPVGREGVGTLVWSASDEERARRGMDGWHPVDDPRSQSQEQRRARCRRVSYDDDDDYDD